MGHYDEAYDEMYAEQRAASKANAERVIPQVVACLKRAQGFLAKNAGDVRLATRIGDDLSLAIAALQGQFAGEDHSDNRAVDGFAAAMKDKLERKRGEGRGGWDNKGECTNEFLSSLLHEHVEKGDPLDVGNLAMMLHQRRERIAANDNTKQEMAA